MIGVIPAAGSGTRMYPFTRANPKELFPIGRKAVIDHVIVSMHRYMGVDKVFIIVGKHKGAIIDHIGDGSRLNNGGLKVAYLFQEELKGLAHAIYQAKGWIDEDFVVHVGDSFIYPMENLKKAVEIHKKENPFATMIVKEVDDPTKYGISKVDRDGYLVDTIEKPTIKEAEPFKLSNGKYLANTAIFIFKPEIFDYIEKTPVGIKNEYQITDSLRIALKDGKRIRVVVMEGEYLDIGNWDNAEKAQEFLRKNN